MASLGWKRMLGICRHPPFRDSGVVCPGAVASANALLRALMNRTGTFPDQVFKAAIPGRQLVPVAEVSSILGPLWDSVRAHLNRQ